MSNPNTCCPTKYFSTFEYTQVTTHQHTSVIALDCKLYETDSMRLYANFLAFALQQVFPHNKDVHRVSDA
eukprot:1190286-Prorocentrum_minimum.AAC.2